MPGFDAVANWGKVRERTSGLEGISGHGPSFCSPAAVLLTTVQHWRV